MSNVEGWRDIWLNHIVPSVSWIIVGVIVLFIVIMIGYFITLRARRRKWLFNEERIRS